MKYIREYNHIGIYSKISGAEYTQYFRTNSFDRQYQFDSINQTEVDKLNDIIPDKRFYARLVRFYHIDIIYNVGSKQLDTTVIRVSKLSDEWYLVNLTGRNIYFKCDQLDGLLSCISDSILFLTDILKKRDYLQQSNENQYYTQEDSNDLRSGPHELITITDKNIDYIKKSLGITNRKDIIEYVRLISGIVVSYYCFYYNTKTGEVGNLSTMNDVLAKDTSFVRVYSYTDEWFRVMIGDITITSNANGYWCDQVEGVVQCVKDSINKDTYYNYIKEGVGEDYYYNIRYVEFTNLLDGPGVGLRNMTYKFNRSELDKLSEETGCTFRLIGGLRGFCLSFNINKNLHMYGEMYKLKDEWYLVDILVKGDHTHYFYKCDQIDGLIKLLKDLPNFLIFNKLKHK